MNCIIQICKYLFYNFTLESEESQESEESLLSQESEESLLSQQTLEYENCIDSSLSSISEISNDTFDNLSD